MKSVNIAHTDSLDPTKWRAAHDRGEVPGVVPYGLHKLADYGFVLTYQAVHAAGRDPRRWLPLLNPQNVRRRPIVGDSDRTSIAWDERAAVGMYVRDGRRGDRLGAGVIWATDQLLRGELRFRQRPLGWVLEQLDFLWCLSRGQIPALGDWLGIDETNIHFLPFGVDVDFFPLRDWDESSPMVLSLGNDRDRDIATLYAALELVHRRRSDIRLVVQSRSNLKPPVGVEVHREFAAPVVRSLFAKSRLVVVATRPNLHVSGMTTVLEAMATGRAVVLSDTPGANDYVQEGTTGRLVRPQDPQALAATMLETLADEPGLARLGRAAAAYVRAHHTEDSMCSALAAIIDRES